MDNPVEFLSVYFVLLQGIVFGTGINSEFGNIFNMMKSEEVGNDALNFAEKSIP